MFIYISNLGLRIAVFRSGKGSEAGSKGRGGKGEHRGSKREQEGAAQSSLNWLPRTRL